MNERIKVEVTQDDIDHGRRGSCRSCPIARAANRMAPEGTYASVDGTYLIFRDQSNNRSHARYRLSLRAVRFVHLVDNGEDVKPTSFVFKKTGWY